MQNGTVQTAILTGVGKTVPSQFADKGKPPRTLVTFSGVGDVWLDQPVVRSLRIGESYTLVGGGKSWQVSLHSIGAASVSSTGPAAPVPVVSPARAPGRTREEREALFQEIIFEAKMIHTCYRQIVENFQEDHVSEERLCKFATTMFINLSRKI